MKTEDELEATIAFIGEKDGKEVVVLNSRFYVEGDSIIAGVKKYEAETGHRFPRAIWNNGVWTEKQESQKGGRE